MTFVNLNFFKFFEIILKLRKLCQLYDNFGEKNDYCLDDPTIFVASLATQAGNGLCLVLNRITVRPTLL